MAKIIYKKGCEGQNKLSCIEGIEIELLNGQKALIYPQYAKRQILTSDQINKWSAKNETEIEALKVEDTSNKTRELLKIGSPAAEQVNLFWSEEYGQFYLPSLLAAMEIQYQKAEIDALAETIEGADLLRDFASSVWSCSRCIEGLHWYAYGSGGCVSSGFFGSPYLVVPTILYR